MQPHHPPAVAETLALRAQGLSIRSIARLRGVKPKTVSTVLHKHAGGITPNTAAIAAGSAQLADAITAMRLT